MTFKPDHWKNPRKTIASRFSGDDLSYATHGALLAMECVKWLGIASEQASKMHLLDYGCGTGRIARVLAGYFGRVTAYDPIPECILLGMRECKVPQTNIEYTCEKPKANTYDVVVSINVLEHLTEAQQETMLDTILQSVKPGEPVMMWYAVRTNQKALIKAFGGGDWVSEDEKFMKEHPNSFINFRIFEALTATK